jgi:UDP-hydrolysing UDP-N-acetyl-D-glucosamine 2-epimerase
VKRKVMVLTGTRAEYGLLRPLLSLLRADPRIDLSLVATGMHLAPEFGLTWKRIEEDGFRVDRKVEMLLSSDTPAGISKSMGLAQIGYADALEQLAPDLLVLLGDRFEILPAAAAAAVARVPVAHIHGGERSEGAVDELIRHAVTKLSHLHFTSTEEYRARVVQMGEDPARVFNVGALGVDNILSLMPTPRAELERELGFAFGPRVLLVTYHPATLEAADAAAQFQALLGALDGLDPALRFVFTKANADAGGRAINAAAEAYCAARPGRAALFASLGQQRYLSLMGMAEAVVGNSSSGIIEAPSLRVPTVNIGTRQQGRVRAASVIDCATDRDSIASALSTALSPAFRSSLAGIPNPYGDGKAAPRIAESLAGADLGSLAVKSFRDQKP